MASLIIFRNLSLKHVTKSDQKIGSADEVVSTLGFRLFEKQRYPITLSSEDYRKEMCGNKKCHGQGKMFRSWKIIEDKIGFQGQGYLAAP